MIKVTNQTKELFPSPLGASYFQMVVGFTSGLFLGGFRPLSGHLISKLFQTEPYKTTCMFPSPLGASYFQIVHFPPLQHLNWYNVSVPSRGILFPNCFEMDTLSNSNSFRPLSGHLISKWTWQIYTSWLLVSVPSRGILFPNTARQSPLFCWLFWLFCVANHFLVYFSYI